MEEGAAAEVASWTVILRSVVLSQTSGVWSRQRVFWSRSGRRGGKVRHLQTPMVTLLSTGCAKGLPM